jgi:CrcB protein
VTPLLVAIGAALGATLRFHVAHRLDGRFPRGTLLVNVAGSFVLGLLVGTAVSADALALLGTGFCGGLTTYSAFAVQTRDRPSTRRGATYAALTLGLALGACALGFWLAQA